MGLGKKKRVVLWFGCVNCEIELDLGPLGVEGCYPCVNVMFSVEKYLSGHVRNLFEYFGF